MKKLWNADNLTGGMPYHDLDAITGYSDGDMCITLKYGDKMYVHEGKASSGQPHDPPAVIAPADVGAGNFRWEVLEVYTALATHDHDESYYTQAEVDTISGTLQDNITTVSGSLQNTIDGLNITTTLLNLTDTPDSYEDGKYLRSTSSGIEFVEISVSGTSDVQSFLDLTDTPNTYSENDGKYLRATASGIEFITMGDYVITTWLTLSGAGMSDSSNAGFPSSNLTDGLYTGGSFYESSVGFPYWIKYDFGDNNAQIIKKYRICAGNSESTRMPKTWTLAGSNNNVDFYTIDTRGNETSWGYYESREYECAISDSYRYIRMSITAGNNATIIRFYEWFLGIEVLVNNQRSLLSLSDTPTTYSGAEGKFLKVTVSGIEFSDVTSSGTSLSLVNDTAPQLGGDLDLNQKSILLDSTPTYDHTWNGTIFNGVAGENLILGDVCYLKSDGKFWKSDAGDSVSVKGMLTMSTDSITATASGTFLKQGFIRDDSWDWVVGGNIYPIAGGGSPTQIEPCPDHFAGKLVRGVGSAYSSDVLWFEPSSYQTLGAAIGLFAGGSVAIDIIEYVTFSIKGNATDFGNLTLGREYLGAVATQTRAVFGGGTATTTNVIDYVVVSSTGDASDFGDLTIARRGISGLSNYIRGLFNGHWDESSWSNTIDYVTIATTGNASDFGDLTENKGYMSSFASNTRGISSGGNTGSVSNVIDYVTIATTGNAIDFGDLTVARSQQSGSSSNTRGMSNGGNDGVGSNVIDYVTIATTGNAIDFGNLTVARYLSGSTSSSIMSITGGGNTGTASNVIDYVTIATTGNSIDFGDLSSIRHGDGGCSNGHGGLY